MSKYISGHITREFAVNLFKADNHFKRYPRLNCGDNKPDCIDYELPTDELALEESEVVRKQLIAYINLLSL